VIDPQATVRAAYDAGAGWRRDAAAMAKFVGKGVFNAANDERYGHCIFLSL
jgi:hypothetical protein